MREKLIESVTTTLEALTNEDFTRLLKTDTKPNYQIWQGNSNEDIQNLISDTLELLNLLKENSQLSLISTSHLTNINNNLINFNNQYQNFKNYQLAQISNQHHACLIILNTIDNLLRTSGVFSIVKLSPNIILNSQIINDQLTNVTKLKVDIDKLVEQVQGLISPAVATALSKSYNDRKDMIYKQKVFWGFAIFISFIAAVVVSVIFSNQISNLLSFLASKKTDTVTIGIIWTVRILVLFPIYYLVYFCVSQYNKERKFEEIYAHKSSVSKTLPSYSELTKTDSIKDQITSFASKIVFGLPEENYFKQERKDSDISTNSAVNEVLDILGKAKNIYKNE